MSTSAAREIGLVLAPGVYRGESIRATPSANPSGDNKPVAPPTPSSSQTGAALMTTMTAAASATADNSGESKSNTRAEALRRRFEEQLLMRRTFGDRGCDDNGGCCRCFKDVLRASGPPHAVPPAAYEAFLHATMTTTAAASKGDAVTAEAGGHSDGPCTALRAVAAERVLRELQGENDALKHRERCLLERQSEMQITIDVLRDELSAAGGTVARQAATLSLLSAEMERRGPCDVVREHRRKQRARLLPDPIDTSEGHDGKEETPQTTGEGSDHCRPSYSLPLLPPPTALREAHAMLATLNALCDVYEGVAAHAPPPPLLRSSSLFRVTLRVLSCLDLAPCWAGSRALSRRVTVTVRGPIGGGVAQTPSYVAMPAPCSRMAATASNGTPGGCGDEAKGTALASTLPPVLLQATAALHAQGHIDAARSCPSFRSGAESTATFRTASVTAWRLLFEVCTDDGDSEDNENSPAPARVIVGTAVVPIGALLAACHPHPTDALGDGRPCSAVHTVALRAPETSTAVLPIAPASQVGSVCFEVTVAAYGSDGRLHSPQSAPPPPPPPSSNRAPSLTPSPSPSAAPAEVVHGEPTQVLTISVEWANLIFTRGALEKSVEDAEGLDGGVDDGDDGAIVGVHARICVNGETRHTAVSEAPSLDSQQGSRSRGATVKWDRDRSAFTTTVRPDDEVTVVLNSIDSYGGVTELGVSTEVRAGTVLSAPCQHVLPIVLRCVPHGAVSLGFKPDSIDGARERIDCVATRGRQRETEGGKREC